MSLQFFFIKNNTAHLSYKMVDKSKFIRSFQESNCITPIFKSIPYCVFSETAGCLGSPRMAVGAMVCSTLHWFPVVHLLEPHLAGSSFVSPAG